MKKSKDGKLLEYVVHEMCTGISGAKITHNAKIDSKSMKRKRQVDVLIEGKIGAFNVKIEVEAKEYTLPVSVTKVESFISKIQDSNIDLGVMVSKKGFTQGAIERAKMAGIQLFKAISDKLDNSNLLIPIRCIIPEIESFKVGFRFRSSGQPRLPQDIENYIRIVKNGNDYTIKDFLMLAWNNGVVPQKKGVHRINFDAMTVKDLSNPNNIQYFELHYDVVVIEKYYARLESASFLENISNSKRDYNLKVNLFNSDDDMKKYWKEFISLEDMNKFVDIANQPNDIQNLIIMPHFTLHNIENA